MIQYGSVNWMLRQLDAEYIAKARERHFRNQMRKFSKRDRKFILAVKRVVEVEKGPENLQAKKIMKRLKIGLRTYERRLENCRKTLPGDTLVGGRDVD